MATYCPDKRGPALYPDCKECDQENCKRFFCLVAGTRTFSDYALLRQKLDYLLKNNRGNVAIVSGGARGADALAKRYAEENGYAYYEFPADWNSYGRRAGIMRNEEMHKFISHFPKRGAVVFWDGKSWGTASSFGFAEKYKNRIVTVRYDAEQG